MGSKYCPECKRESKSDFNEYCTACGTKLAYHETVCPECHSKRETSEDKFCWRCGFVLSPIKKKV